MNGSLSASTAEGKSKSAFEERFGLKVKTDFEEDFLACSGEYVVELAGASAVKRNLYSCPKERQKLRLYFYWCTCWSSHSLEQVKAEAELSGAALYVANGAIGGLDFLQTLSFSGLSVFSLNQKLAKIREGLEGSPGLHGKLLSKTEEKLHLTVRLKRSY